MANLDLNKGVANARDYVPGKERFLLVGTPGGGKSTLFRTLPGRKFAYVFDQNAVSSYAGSDIDYKTFFPSQLNLDVVPLKDASVDQSQQVRPLAYTLWEEHFEEALARGFFKDYDWVGFDGFTAFQLLVMDHTMWLNGRYGRWPTEGDYTPVIATFTNIARAITSIPNGVFATAHLKPNKTGGPELMNVYGVLRLIIPGMFTDIYKIVADTDKSGARSFFAVTSQDSRTHYLRCSLPNVSPEEDVTIRDWKRPEDFGLGALLRKQPELQGAKK